MEPDKVESKYRTQGLTIGAVLGFFIGIIYVANNSEPGVLNLNSYIEYGFGGGVIAGFLGWLFLDIIIWGEVNSNRQLENPSDNNSDDDGES